LQTIWVTDRRTGAAHPVFSETQYYTRIGPGDTTGPIILLRWSGDDRWIFFTVDPGSSGSIAADGLILRVVSAAGGPVHEIAWSLASADYMAWCGGKLVLTAGNDRVAVQHKRLLVAAPPGWRAHPLARAPGRAWGSIACAPDGRSVVAQSQLASNNASFFATRWQLWRVGLDGSRRQLTSPPAHYADESPRFSRDGRTIVFVRSRHGRGQVYALRGWKLTGPLLSLGYQLGFYGHQNWWTIADWSLGAPR
jgi:Tol biopolymer transport system component